MTKYHFIGIKGSGMSALAQILYDIGYDVQGSDVETRIFTQEPLEQRGIPIHPFDETNIEKEMCIIAGNAFGDDHVEINKCITSSIPVYRYHEFLGEFAQGFTSVAVTGAHGKTSTTGLLAHVLKGIRPTSFLIGDGTGGGTKDSDYFVFEACEYKRHFLAYHPEYAIITNIDFDHPDYFASIDDVLEAFQQFVTNVQKRVIACGDNVYVRKLSPTAPILYYGLDSKHELYAKNVTSDHDGMSFDVVYRNQELGNFQIPIFGTHNVLNALSVIGVCLLEQIPLEEVRRTLKTFPGVKRRFHEKRVRNNILIDDYAHHPTEIEATIQAVRFKYPNKHLVTIFQPHTYTRTATFLNQFAQALAKADQTYICDIFGSAREHNQTISSDELIKRIPSSQYISEKTIDQLRQYDDVILLFMGAGDIQKLQSVYEQDVITNEGM